MSFNTTQRRTCCDNVVYIWNELHMYKEIDKKVLMFVMLFKEIMLLSLVHEFRETDWALQNVKGVDGCATCEGIGVKKFKAAGLKSSRMRRHITRSPVTSVYTVQYTHSSINLQTVLYAVLSLSHLNRHQHPSYSRLLNVNRILCKWKNILTILSPSIPLYGPYLEATKQ